MNFKKRMIIWLVLLVFSAHAQQKKYYLHTLAFYNFENLFDPIDDENNDDEWTPKGLQRWTPEKYKQKLENLSTVLMQIGTNEQQKETPTFIGCCEVENRGVLEDLVKHPNLIKSDYGIVHFDSPDKRGIDVGLLYNKKHFKPTTSVNIPLIIYRSSNDKKEEKNDDEDTNEDDIVKTKEQRVYTRDILLVTGFLDGEEINLLINHWPSRSGGAKKSNPYREAAGKLARKITDSIHKINPKAKIILMGDLNDSPVNNSIKVALGAKSKKNELGKFDLYNPFEQMLKDGNATLFFRDSGDIFDQIMVSKNLIQENRSSYQFWKSGIFNKPFLIQKLGKYAGYPLRHSANEIGYSDHFPVYIYLIKEVN